MLTFEEVNDKIPYMTGIKLYTQRLALYPAVEVRYPGRHQYDTSPIGGDAVVIATDQEAGWNKKKFTHHHFFEDIELKRDADFDGTYAMMEEYISVLHGEKPTGKDYELPGVDSVITMQSLQVISVIEHRRYARYEKKFGGRFLFPRFAFGIVEGLWSANDAAKKEGKGKPGVEWLEKDHGTPVLTTGLMNYAGK